MNVIHKSLTLIHCKKCPIKWNLFVYVGWSIKIGFLCIRFYICNLYRTLFPTIFTFLKFFWYLSWTWTIKVNFISWKSIFQVILFPRRSWKTIHLIHLRFLQNIRDKGYSRNKGKIQPKNGFCNLISAYHI